MNDLVTWLRAQLDEDEERTRELLYWTQQTILALKEPKLLGKYIPGWHDWPKVERLCRERLAEVDAKRRILDDAAGYIADGMEAATDGLAGRVVAYLALPYADRPGYRDEWRPE
ncbi:DUF6221 family protein [Micromonospora sp. DT229]|uniref:DUF6221 family protein n=1 Tax=Micromonospora sp. DT229 TaxID=3393430 RepID=UPI003CED24A4